MSRPSLADKSYRFGLIVESWRLWEGIANSLDAPVRRISDWRMDSDYFEVNLPQDCQAAIVIAQGASMAADAVERLIGSEASAIVRLGTTGGLRKSQAIGDVVVSYAAIRGEGTSGYYLPSNVPVLADLPLVLNLCDVLSNKLGKLIEPALVWSTDARWVESDADLTAYANIGAAAVDMESAAVFAVGMHYGIPVASVSLVADVPILHIGQEFKGLPAAESEWSEGVLPVGRLALTTILDCLYRYCRTRTIPL